VNRFPEMTRRTTIAGIIVLIIAMIGGASLLHFFNRTRNAQRTIAQPIYVSSLLSEKAGFQYDLVSWGTDPATAGALIGAPLGDEYAESTAFGKRFSLPEGGRLSPSDMISSHSRKTCDVHLDFTEDSFSGFWYVYIIDKEADEYLASLNLDSEYQSMLAYFFKFCDTAERSILPPQSRKPISGGAEVALEKWGELPFLPAGEILDVRVNYWQYDGAENPSSMIAAYYQQEDKVYLVVGIRCDTYYS